MRTEEVFSNSHGVVPIHWDEYKLEIIQDGRLFSFNDAGVSPLKLKNKNGDVFWAYNPWFSLIDGEIVITR